ncbi:MAG: hypothetical protein HRU02_07615 [Myxococcales bacterium]|nr:hypothetical protein [Myxococcales bacterium]
MLTARGRVLLLGLWLGFAGLLAWWLEAPPFGTAVLEVASDDPERGGFPIAVRRLAPKELLGRLPVTRKQQETGLNVRELPGGAGRRRFFEYVDLPAKAPGVRPESFTVEYTLDADLSRRVFRILKRRKVDLGHVILMDPVTGRLLAYASTDVDRFSPTRDYPAASLVKVITAAAALERNPDLAKLPCRYRGNKYKLTPSSLDPPEGWGTETKLRIALATSNNKCFAQLAVHAVGAAPLLESIRRFGWFDAPAPSHAAGSADAGPDRYQLGRLGSGLAGARITPLHAAQLAATLVEGELVAPRWIERVEDSLDRPLKIPARSHPRRVLSREVAQQLRGWLVATTSRGDGTAHGAFFDRKGRPLLGEVRVAGKTGSLRGVDPDGLYQWFIGLAPAEAPRIVVATLLVQGDLYWRRSAEVAAEVLQAVFCEGRRCSAERVGRFLAPAQRGPKLAGAPGEALAKGAAGLRRVAGASAALAGASEGGPSAR